MNCMDRDGPSVPGGDREGWSHDEVRILSSSLLETETGQRRGDTSQVTSLLVEYMYLNLFYFYNE